MLDVYAQKFYRIGTLIGSLRAALPPHDGIFESQVSDEFKDAFTNNLQLAATWCKEIRLNAVTRYAESCLATPRNQLTLKRVRKMLEGLQERLDENLSAVYFKHVAFENVPLHQAPSVFGLQVAIRFPSAGYDIKEAAQCLALDRYTACVMHLMRVNEVGLKAFGTSMNVMAQIKQAQADWGTVLRIAGDEIQRLNKSPDPTWTPEKRAFFEETHAYLHAVRVAWRNRSMHADQQYDLPRAKRIFEAVRDWMRHLADHLDEAGTFKP